MKNKFNIGQVVFIAIDGFVIQTTVISVMTDIYGNNPCYDFAGRKVGHPNRWESDVFDNFNQASVRAENQ